MLDAANRLKELQRQISEDGSELQHHYSDALAEKRFALISQVQPIYDGVPGKLREEIGDDAAKKAEAFFERHWGGLQTKTVVYFYRRPSMSVYLGELPNIGEKPQEVKHE